MKHQRSLRIIGGKWRGRKVSFSDRKEIRPTGDRIRETLFNWLTNEMADACCLDLFAGSGILGIEALSRGAAKLTFVDREKDIAQSIKDNLESLGANNFKLRHNDATTFLEETEQVFDVIFLDPPFHQDNLNSLISIIKKRGLSHGLVYVETESTQVFSDLPDYCDIYRQKKAGRVCYGLISIS